MQAINRIQNAMINANAGNRGAMGVDSANAHRAYLSLKPCDPFKVCDPSPVSKCPGQVSGSQVIQPIERVQRRSWLERLETDRLVYGASGSMWGPEGHHHQMPAMLWATLVLNRTLCG